MISLGIVGLGTMGTLYARLAGQNPWVSLRALCDPDARRREAAAAEFPSVPRYADLEAALAEESLDAVCIATPDDAHLRPALLAAQAGCHILIEKPLATTVDEAQQIVGAIQRAGVRCQIAYTNRWTPPYVALKDLLARGELGRLVSLNARINNTRFTPTSMLSWATRSSPAWFLMTHALDMARWLTESEVHSVYAVGAKGVLTSQGIDAYDTIQALFTFQSGVIACIESCWVLPEGMPLIFDFQFEVVGSRSAAFVNTHDQMIRLVTGQKTQHPTTLLLNLHGQLAGHSQHMFDSFIAAVRDGRPPLVTETDGYRNVVAIAAVHQSLATGAPVTVA